jgi:hypothetical protein
MVNLQRLNEFPPFLIYALARDGKRGFAHSRPTQRVLAMRAGIPLRTFQSIVSRVSWDNVTLAQQQAVWNVCVKRQDHLKTDLRHMMLGEHPFPNITGSRRQPQLAWIRVRMVRWMALRTA